jgi:hypothetical protein
VGDYFDELAAAGDRMPAASRPANDNHEEAVETVQ